MSHEQLWAPWRIGYIRGTNPPPAKPDRPMQWLPGADQDCFLCRYVADAEDRENLVVSRGQHTIVVLNLYPYNNGHLLVAPLEHRGGLEELNAAAHLEIMETISRQVRSLRRAIKPDGFNIGLNLGRAAGAGLPAHLHWHIVPRWNGDTNFMPVLTGTSVIPQSLDALLALLHQFQAEDDATV